MLCIPSVDISAFVIGSNTLKAEGIPTILLVCSKETMNESEEGKE